MQVIFLQNKSMKTGFFFLAAAFMILLLTSFTLWQVSMKSEQKLLLVLPVHQGPSGFTAQELEDFIKEEFLLTYEIHEQQQVKASSASYSAHTIGTNADYPQILGYPLLSGSFFSPAAFKEQNRQVVLNQNAAYRWFGNLNLSGNTIQMGEESWLVTGVIDDGLKKEARVYLPASLAHGQSETLLVSLDDQTISDVYVRSALKKLGIQKEQYSFVNLERLAASSGQRLGLVCGLLLLSGLALVFFVGIYWFWHLFSNCRMQLQELYFSQLWQQHRRQILRLLLLTLSLAAGFAVMLLLGLRLLEVCLSFKDLLPANGRWYTGDFAPRFKALHHYLWVDLGVTGLALLLLLPLTVGTARRLKQLSRIKTKAKE